MSKELEILNDSDLQNIAGGRIMRQSKTGNGLNSKTSCKCEKCGTDTPHTCFTGTRAVCDICGAETSAC